MIDPVFGLEASLTVPVARTFHVGAIEALLWVHLPEPVRYMSVWDVLDESDTSIEWERAGQESWIAIDTAQLHTAAGFHRYQIKLIDPVTQVTTHVWFAYNIQNDSPERPYYYMANQRGEE